tara:strand:+ start:14127 stop:14363 length:237 start_codon:yes stop_codon:yes gene_type:complete
MISFFLVFLLLHFKVEIIESLNKREYTIEEIDYTSRLVLSMKHFACEPFGAIWHHSEILRQLTYLFLSRCTSLRKREV